ncbi:Casp10p [Branchiostoma belcheri]|nr:Casp10p [Branchiostoma belcheri]
MSDPSNVTFSIISPDLSDTHHRPPCLTDTIIACIVVSGLPDRANSQKLREHFQTARLKSGIRLVTFSKIGAALIEFQTPEDAADVLANEALLQVRWLPDVFPRDENKETLAGGECTHALVHFLLSLPGRHQVSNGNLADPDMDPDGCLVVSGFPDGVSSWPFYHCTKHLLRFPETGTVLAEFSSPEGAAEVIANKRRLMEETGLQVRKLATVMSPKEDVTPQQTQVSQLQQKLRNKEQELQQVTTVNKSLQAALRREREAQNISINLSRKLKKENSHLKDQTEADKRKIEGLENKLQISSSTEISSLYEMTCDPRGVAVIINNIRFEDMAEREGAEGDTGCV